MLRILFSSILLLFQAKGEQAGDKEILLTPETAVHVQKIHQGFKGQKGYVAQFGDSITYSMAFWSVMSWSDPSKFLKKDKLPKSPSNSRWRDTIKGARDKGPKFANYSGWRVGQLLKGSDDVLNREKPELAIIMIGTNDISENKVPATYRNELQKVITKCLEAHCIPILNTIPPRRGHDESVEKINTIVHDLAKSNKIPLVDFHAAILSRRPGKTWDGTLISKDGVHPSGGKSNLYDEENLKNCGYALRNWLNFLMIRRLHIHLTSA